jgi:hypothetical protein
MLEREIRKPSERCIQVKAEKPPKTKRLCLTIAEEERKDTAKRNGHETRN